MTTILTSAIRLKPVYFDPLNEIKQLKTKKRDLEKMK